MKSDSIFRKLLAMSVITLCLCCVSCFQGGLGINKYGEDDIKRSYAKIAEQFIEIIKNKDINAFLDFMGPPGSESRLSIESDLADKKSSLYEAFFGKEALSLPGFTQKGIPLWVFMMDARKLDYEIVAYPDRPDDEMVNVFEVIYYDKRKIKSLKGLDLEELRRLGYDYRIWVLTFFQLASGYEPPDHPKGQWYLVITGHGIFWSHTERAKEQFPLE